MPIDETCSLDCPFDLKRPHLISDHPPMGEVIQKAEPYGTGWRLAWCPWCAKANHGQAPVVAVAPNVKMVVCEEHGMSPLAPPLGPKPTFEKVFQLHYKLGEKTAIVQKPLSLGSQDATSW